MKVYVAADFERKEEVRQIHERLKQMGYDISFDWTTHKPISPFSQNKEMAIQYSTEDLEGARNSDIFIMLHGNGKTKFIEFGIVLERHKKEGKPVIYVVGHPDQNMVYSQTYVRIRDNIENVYHELELMKSREF